MGPAKGGGRAPRPPPSLSISMVPHHPSTLLIPMQNEAAAGTTCDELLARLSLELSHDEQDDERPAHGTDSDLNDAYLDRLLNDDGIGAAIDSVLVEEPLLDEESGRDFSDPSLESTFRTVLVENLPPSRPIKRLQALLQSHKCPPPEKIVSIFGIGDQPRRAIIRFVDPEAAAIVVKCNGAVCMDREVSFRLYNPVEDALSSLRSYEPVSPRGQGELDAYVAVLTSIAEGHYKANKPTQTVISKRDLLFSELNQILNESEVYSKLLKHVDYLPDDGSPGLQLEQFGSVPALISSRHSDLDICIVGESLDCLAVLKDWIRVLRRKRLGRLQFIGRARVPVIKLTHYATKLEVDFTVKDDVVNQRLKTWFIRACVQKDDRVAKLIMLIKFWSKQRDIGDASTGTLNSFGFSLLVIHFLQCGCGDRPVLPRVIPDGPIDTPAHGCNPFQVKSFMKWQTQNTSSMGELLYGFFEYYATSWDVTSEIISVRECKRIHMPLPLRPGKFHKTQKWLMVIQDPFDRLDNVARNVSKDATKRIITEMRRAYDMMRRCSPWSEISEKVQQERPKPRPFQRPTKPFESAANVKSKKKSAVAQPSRQAAPTSSEPDSNGDANSGQKACHKNSNTQRPRPSSQKPINHLESDVKSSNDRPNASSKKASAENPSEANKSLNKSNSERSDPIKLLDDDDAKDDAERGRHHARSKKALAEKPAEALGKPSKAKKALGKSKSELSLPSSRPKATKHLQDDVNDSNERDLADSDSKKAPSEAPAESSNVLNGKPCQVRNGLERTERRQHEIEPLDERESNVNVATAVQIPSKSAIRRAKKEAKILQAEAVAQQAVAQVINGDDPQVIRPKKRKNKRKPKNQDVNAVVNSAVLPIRSPQPSASPSIMVVE